VTTGPLLALRLGWRNLWRNARRTAITLGAVALSTAILIVGQALITGLLDGAVRNATQLSVGEVQIHAPGWLADRSIYTALPEPDRVLAALDAAGLAAAPRSYGDGLVAHATKSAGALFWGIDPARERRTFDLAAHVASGSFLDERPAGDVVLGRKLARTLGVHSGDELVVVVQAADVSLGNELYRVRGVLKAVGETVDRGAALLHRADFDALFVSGGRVHEVAASSRGTRPLAEVEAIAASAAPGQDVRTWRQLLPMLSDMLANVDGLLWIVAVIFFLTAGLGVMNTMLMATHERVREFGVLKALGTSPWRIAGDVATESLVLAALGTLVGVALGSAAALWLATHGIDTVRLAGETSFAGVAFDPIWRASMHPTDLIAPVLVMWVTCVAAALYPAVLAARLDPVRAMGRV
jgi:ABC-type lipoprotein release transport system permease subunit